MNTPERESPSDRCRECGHERGEHFPNAPICQVGLRDHGRPCGCASFTADGPVDIPLPPEPPRDRVIEAVDQDGTVRRRYVHSDGYWGGIHWSSIVGWAVEHHWSLRHVAAESGEQT